MRLILQSRALLVLSLLLLATVVEAQGSSSLEGRIANGLPTQQFPSTGYLILPGTLGVGFCSGVLIGCQTFLTAAHCICTDDSGTTFTGTECIQNHPELLNPAGKTVFLQNAGNFAVQSISVDPAFNFGVRGDFAVLHLKTPVTGVAPSALDTTGRAPSGTAGTIVGFGLSGGDAFDVGIKRTGKVVTSTCPSDLVPDTTHVCWAYQTPIGAPGTDSDTCEGDSGGPLFVDLGHGPVLAGITSGGDTNCVPTDHSFDADVFVHLAFLTAAGGSDLGTASCGALPAAGGPGTTVVTNSGSLSPSKIRERFTVNVPAGTARLRVTLNNTADSDFDLYIRQGANATPTVNDCKSESGLYPDACDILSPTPGPCIPSDTAICLGAGGRFKVEATWKTATGASGPAHAVPLTADSGYLWFFDANNVEAVVKVLDACSFSGHFWVFAGGLTNVETTLNVTDTQTGVVRSYFNPQNTAFQPLQDTGAFATCP